MPLPWCTSQSTISTREAAPEPHAHDARDAAADAAYYADGARSGFEPQPASGSAAHQVLARGGPGASLRTAPVAFLESGMDVLTTRAGPWFEVLPFFVAPHTRPAAS